MYCLDICRLSVLSIVFQIYLDAFESQGPFYRCHQPGTPGKPIRYGTQVVEINKLKSVMKSIAKKEGLQWNYINHGGKNTCAAQPHVGRVLEAEIMSVTGHRSQQGVRKYMRSNVDIKRIFARSWVRLYQHQKKRWNRLQKARICWNRLHHCMHHCSAENGPYLW